MRESECVAVVKKRYYNSLMQQKLRISAKTKQQRANLNCKQVSYHDNTNHGEAIHVV